MTNWANDVRLLLTEFWLVWTSTDWFCGDNNVFDWDAAFEYWVQKSQELHERLQQRRYWFVWYRMNGRRLPTRTLSQMRKDAEWADKTIDIMEYAMQLPLQDTYCARTAMLDLAINVTRRIPLLTTLIDKYNRQLWICLPPTLEQFDRWNDDEDVMETTSIAYIDGKPIYLDWIFG